MEAQFVRVDQVTGACDHISFSARCRMRQRTHVRKDMGDAWRCMGGAWGISNKGYLDKSCMAYPRLTGDFIFSMILPRCKEEAQEINGCRAKMPLIVVPHVSDSLTFVLSNLSYGALFGIQLQ